MLVRASSSRLVPAHLTSPHLTSPRLTFSHLTATGPHLFTPHLISPLHTSPHLPDKLTLADVLDDHGLLLRFKRTCLPQLAEENAAFLEELKRARALTEVDAAKHVLQTIVARYLSQVAVMKLALPEGMREAAVEAFKAACGTKFPRVPPTSVATLFASLAQAESTVSTKCEEHMNAVSATGFTQPEPLFVTTEHAGFERTELLQPADCARVPSPSFSAAQVTRGRAAQADRKDQAHARGGGRRARRLNHRAVL